MAAPQHGDKCQTSGFNIESVPLTSNGDKDRWSIGCCSRICLPGGVDCDDDVVVTKSLEWQLGRRRRRRNIGTMVLIRQIEVNKTTFRSLIFFCTTTHTETDFSRLSSYCWIPMLTKSNCNGVRKFSWAVMTTWTCHVIVKCVVLVVVGFLKRESSGKVHYFPIQLTSRPIIEDHFCWRQNGDSPIPRYTNCEAPSSHVHKTIYCMTMAFLPMSMPCHKVGDQWFLALSRNSLS